MFRFRILGMPVVVRGSFLLIAAFIGYIGMDDIPRTAAWIAIVFISILVHELGHALTARTYGSTVAIELNGLGGLTRWAAPDGELTPGRRAVIAAAGSATGLLLGGLVWVLARQGGPYPPLLTFVLESIVYVNVFWGLLNWLPIRPLDGGHLLISFLEKVAPKRVDVIARAVFITTAAIGVVVGIRLDRLFIAILAGWMLLSEFATSSDEARRPTPGLPTLSYEEPTEDVEAHEGPVWPRAGEAAGDDTEDSGGGTH